MVERNLTQFISFFPVCSYQTEHSASHDIPIIIYADQNYRDQYGYKWKTMLRRRMVFVNDVYRKYFDLEFNIKGFREWETNHQDSLSYVVNQLIEDTRDVQNAIVLAVVLDRRIIFNRIIFSDDMDEQMIGIALLTRNRCAIKDLPTTKTLRIWDSLEESVVLIHELAHLLGGIHILDPRSNMFPAAGTMSYQFDDLNTSIINLTKERIFTLNKASELREYVEEILKVYNRSKVKNVYISGLMGILGNHYLQAGGSEDSLKHIFRVPWTYHAALGYVYYEREEWEKSSESYHEAVRHNEDIASLYSDLGRSYSKRDKKKKAQQYFKKARDKGMKTAELE
jgi:tetratricopeptide (TPR) repeat protein